MFNIKKYLIFSLLPLILLGCGNEGDNNGGPSPQKKIAINAQDLLSFSSTKNTQVIDLRERVTAEDNQQLIIENIENIDNNCDFNKSDINGLTFKVRTGGANVCRFKYHVKTQSSKYTGTSEAIAQVVVTDDYTKGDFLPPVSRTITESDLLTLNAKDLLIESGFEIDPTSVYLTGETASSDIGSVTADSSSITYQAPTMTTGTVRIFYTEIDSINNIARPGVAYIAIGQKGNHNPIALDRVLEPLPLTSGNVNIDISDYISDPDMADTLQLINVKTFLGTMKIDSSHSFIYTPNEIGTEVLTYIISDHNGGYGIGRLSFTVSPYETIIDDIQKLIFTPPLTTPQLSEINGTFTNVFKENGTTGITGTYPTFDHILADAYCTTKGMRTASFTELEQMRINVLGDKSVFRTKYLWHSGQPYVTIDGTAISLDSGIEDTSSTDGYFSCTDTITPRSWTFAEEYYPAKYNQTAKVYLTAKSASGNSIFLAPSKYDLSYKVEAINVNGTLIDLALADNFIKVTIASNSIKITKKPGNIDDAVNVTLRLSDPIAPTSTTKVILGISTCPSDVTEPQQADSLGCVIPIKGWKTEKFTLALTNNIMEIAGLSPTEINSLSKLQVGNGSTFVKALQWSKPTTTVEDRENWLKLINKVCTVFNKMKLSGRDNWTSGSDNIPHLTSSQTNRRLFDVNSDYYPQVRGFVKWLSEIDGNSLGWVSYYGLGYVNSDPTDLHYVNEKNDSSEFHVQSGKTQLFKDTYSYPSCWSRN
ncbi:Ig-like domain-containing protein [Photobacterium phosphoreum]|uniref:Ig-like domain-containing protein n=1 Tax=Photobacterium phosphoreum TaxID=659 RepID=UPI001E4201ED|nr:hypothetical protein [Photobacterium phosphoreum]MCD9510945.1 hypothetical protein [Photobacterium phosphoreum]